MKDARFHNPYTFIWTPARNRALGDPFAGDADPAAEADHGRIHSERFTGTIRVKLTVKTPLLLVDTDPSKVTTIEGEAGHRVFDSRDDIPVTELKGMIRSAYETVTNSRYGVFAGHDRPLGRRTAANMAPYLVPGRIQQEGDRLKVRLLRGKSEVAPAGAYSIKNGRRKDYPEGQPVRTWRTPQGIDYNWGHGYAASLPRYDRSSDAPHRGERGEYADGSGKPAHGDPCWIELDREKFGWKVKAIWPRREADRDPPPQADQPYPGWVYRTGPTIKDKHQERVFFEPLNRPPLVLSLAPRVIRAYEDLIADYQETHRREAEERRRAKQEMSDYLGPNPGETAFGPYAYEESRRKLRPGDLIFVRLENGQPAALYPCMISRDLHPASPEDLLDETLRPAEKPGELSPADRLFGWVRQRPGQAEPAHEAAWRGRIRVTTSTEDQDLRFQELSSEEQPHGLPLAILGEPKPAQARFYVGQSGGNPLEKGWPRDRAVYREGLALRGRKAYWHHPDLPAGYWDEPTEDRTHPPGAEPGYHQEYRRPWRPEKGERDSQNRSIRQWIAPGSTATFTLHLTNASLQEIGALLYLASLPDGYCHRLGGGKPLGFGSVRLELADGEDGSVRLADGKTWGEFYRSLDAKDPAWETGLVPKAQQAFFKAMAGAYSDVSEGSSEARFRSLRFIRHFEAVCRGPEDGVPIHYPRVTAAQEPEGKNFEWFVENEHVEAGRPAGWSLPEPTEAGGLPYWAWGVDPRQRQQSRSGGGGGRRSQGRRGGGSRAQDGRGRSRGPDPPPRGGRR